MSAILWNIAHWPSYAAPASWEPALAYSGAGPCLGGQGARQRKGHTALPGPAPPITSRCHPTSCLAGSYFRVSALTSTSCGEHSPGPWLSALLSAEELLQFLS